MVIDQLEISSGAFQLPRAKEHNPLTMKWIRCLVIEWNDHGQPRVVRTDIKEPYPEWIWPLSMIKDYENSKGAKIRQARDRNAAKSVKLGTGVNRELEEKEN